MQCREALLSVSMAAIVSWLYGDDLAFLKLYIVYKCKIHLEYYFEGNYAVLLFFLTMSAL